MNIVDPILFQCRRQPPVAAICAPDSGIGLISYRRLAAFIHNVERKLHAFGLPERSIVAVRVEDIIFHIVIVLALTRLGVITLSMRKDATSVPISADALITTSDLPPADFGRVFVADLSWTEGDGHPLEAQHLPQTHEDDLCRIILTSGTTNEAKAVALSHKLLASRIGRHLSVFGNRLGNCHRVYNDMPIPSSLGFQFLIYALWRGGTTLFPGETFDETLRALDQYRMQCLVSSPGGFETLLRCFDAVPSYQSNAEVLFCGGDVLSRSLSNRLRGRICSHLVAAYGSTEASMSAVAHAHEIADSPRAVGFVTPGVAVQIVDSSGTVLRSGEEGQVRIRSDYAVRDYFANPDASAKVFRDGWFYPGDLGTLSAEGLLSITGREQLVLNLGGDKVSPETIELVLAQFDGVVEAAALGVPNEYGNAEVCAVIVGRQDLDRAKLREFCEARISRAFAPTRYHFVDGLPHNEMGKIDRRKLQDVVNRMFDR